MGVWGTCADKTRYGEQVYGSKTIYGEQVFGSRIAIYSEQVSSSRIARAGAGLLLRA